MSGCAECGCRLPRWPIAVDVLNHRMRVCGIDCAEKRVATLRPRKWEIRAEPTESIPIRAGEKPEPGVRVAYRRLGSRGKFKTFVLVGDLPAGKSIFDVVNA